MIELHKTSEPSELTNNKSQWTAKHLADLAKGVASTVEGNYRRPTIKAAVIAETHGKCVYCESKITHVSYGDIEHIRPKSVHPELIFEWANLTLACSICNNNKNDYDSDTLPLINPYIDQPSDHIAAFGPMITSTNSSMRGEFTANRIKLNRIELLERRTERLSTLNSLLERWKKEVEPQRKQLLKMQLDEEKKQESEFSFVVDRYLSANGVV